MTTPRWLMLCAVVGVVSYAWGRQSSTPAAVDAQERSSETVAVQQEVSAAVEREATTEATEATEAMAETTSGRVRVSYRERDPDGSSRELELEAEVARLLEEVQASRAVEVQASASEVRVETVEVEVVREVERRVEVRTPLPDWRISGMAGLDLRAGLIYGAHVERRILGPVYLGAWGMSHGAGGLSLGVTF